MEDNTRAIALIKEILSWDKRDDADKRFFIQSMLLGWADEETIHRITRYDHLMEEEA